MTTCTVRTFILAGLLLGTFGFAKDRKVNPSVPPAPLPTEIIKAQTVYLSKGQGSDPYLKGGAEYAFDVFYSEIKNWPKYRIVGSRDDADLIFELSYSSQRVGTRVWSTTNTYTGATQVHSAPEMDPRVTFTVYNGKTGVSLWTVQEERDTARRRKNRQKNLTNTLHEMIQNFRSRVEASAAS
jgi:hypothetical protein